MNRGDHKVLDFSIGLCVIFLCAFVLYSFSPFFSFRDSNYYKISAYFSNADGLQVGSSVKVSGVKIGEVESISLDLNRYVAMVNLRVFSDIKIPNDSSAIVATSGIIGEKYIKVDIGGNTDFLSDGSLINNTQSSLNLESLIVKMFSSN